MYLYHYYDKRSGPFKSITALSESEAKEVFDRVRAERPGSFGAQRDETYIEKRRSCEALIRNEFIKKGGIVEVDPPYYMVVEHCPWLYSWYEEPDYIKIPIEEFDLKKISFTYGDSMPTFSPRVNDGKEYRKRLYTYEEILGIIDKYGLPQEWNADGTHGPERYIEVHVWSEEVIRKFREDL
jgi:hypothetical protein